jgi:hypothetical protein
VKTLGAFAAAGGSGRGRIQGLYENGHDKAKKWSVNGKTAVAAFRFAAHASSVIIQPLGMRSLPELAESRREFVRTAARYGLMVALTVTSGLAMRFRGPSRERCVSRGICGACNLSATCGLPAALSAQRARGGVPG